MPSWINPVNWISWAIGRAGGVLSDVEHWVADAVSYLIGIINSWYAWIYNWASEVFNLFARQINGVFQSVTGAWNLIFHTIETTIPDAVNFVLTLMSEAVGAAEKFASEALNGLEYFLEGLIGAVSTYAHWLYNTVVAPVVAWIAQAAAWAGHLIGSALSAFYDTFVAPIINELGQLATDAYHWISWLQSTAFGAVGLVIKATEWLVWMGEHTIDDLINEATAFPSSIGGSILGMTLSGEPQYEGVVEDWLLTILGE